MRMMLVKVWRFQITSTYMGTQYIMMHMSICVKAKVSVLECRIVHLSTNIRFVSEVKISSVKHELNRNSISQRKTETLTFQRKRKQMNKERK